MINLLSELVILVTHVTALTKDILCRPHVECVVQAENRILLPIQITIRPPFALSITPPSSWGIAPPKHLVSCSDTGTALVRLQNLL